MNPKIRTQLSVMMFLQYLVWGAWYVTMGTYLGETLQFNGNQIGAAYSSTAIGAMISPFLVGMIADRFFSTEKVLGFLHILGGVILFFTSFLTEFQYFYPGLIAYTVCYMPTIALTNSFSFNQMSNPGKEFGFIRVFGTAGWIVIGLIIGFLEYEDKAIQFQIASGVSVIFGLYCFTLPNMPPKAKEKATIRDVLGLDALALMKKRSFAVLVIASFLLSIPLSFYYNFTNLFLNNIGMENAAGKMTIGQASELLFMVLMPFFFARLGFKKMLALGMIAWVARYALFMMGNNELLVWMLYIGIFLHGICYDFFFVVGQIYVDEKAPKHLKSAAQGFITLATYGVGMFIGAWVSGEVVNTFSTQLSDGGFSYNWENIWLVPAIGSAIVLVFFVLLFYENHQDKRSGEEGSVDSEESTREGA